MYTLGHDFVPARFMPVVCATTDVPLISHLVKLGYLEAVAVPHGDIRGWN